MTTKKPKATVPPSKITSETKRQIEDAFEQSLCSIGFPSFQEAGETLRRAVSGEVSPDKDWEAVVGATAMKIILDLIENRPEPSPAELKEILEKATTLPFGFRGALEWGSS